MSLFAAILTPPFAWSRARQRLLAQTIYILANPDLIVALIALWTRDPAGVACYPKSNRPQSLRTCR